MAKNETTSPDIATLASRALRKPGSLSKSEIKSLAAAALTQAADRVKDIVAAIVPATAKPAKPKTAANPKTATKPKPAAKAKAKQAATAKPSSATPKAAKAKTAKRAAKPTKPKSA